MTGKTKIEWTDKSWNPIVGCSVVSPGCANCYAMRFAGSRLQHTPSGAHYIGLTQKSKAGPVWTGKLALAPEKTLLAPLRWKQPAMIFVNSMGDLFHEDCPDEWIDRVFAVMALCPQHTFQVLTKRAERMRSYFNDDRAMQIGCALGNMLDGDWIWGEGKQFRQQIDGMISLAHGMAPDDIARAREEFLPLPNVWLGISAEDQTRADERIPALLATPAAVRFVSAEPLLGPIDFGDIQHIDGDREISVSALTGEAWVENSHNGAAYDEAPRLNWIIVGGESGRDARPMHPDWARSIRDQCAAASVPFFFKQWGEWGPAFRADLSPTGQPWSGRDQCAVAQGTATVEQATRRLGKARTGRLLDGVTHDGMPERADA